MAYGLEQYENFGDVSPQHGQTWIRYGDSDYAECVEILSGSVIGLADNQYMIRRGSVYFAERHWDSAMACCDTGIYGPPTYADIAYSFYAYSGIEMDTYKGFEIVQIGAKPDDFCARGTTCDEPDKILHGNTCIEKYIAENWLV